MRLQKLSVRLESGRPILTNWHDLFGNICDLKFLVPIIFLDRLPANDVAWRRDKGLRFPISFVHTFSIVFCGRCNVSLWHCLISPHEISIENTEIHALKYPIPVPS